MKNASQKQNTLTIQTLSDRGHQCTAYLYIIYFIELQETSTRPYKYVVAGHGKYTKASADNGCSEDVSGQAGKKSPLLLNIMKK